MPNSSADVVLSDAREGRLGPGMSSGCSTMERFPVESAADTATSKGRTRRMILVEGMLDLAV